MSMVEKVARTICEATGLRWEDQANALTSGGGSDDEQQGYRDQARAAIEAMREPSNAMAEAGAENAWQSAEDISQTWRIMIDAALATEKGE